MTEKSKDMFDDLIFGSKSGNELKEDKDKVSEIIKEWLNSKNIEMKTELNQNQIYAVTVLMTLANQYDITPLKKLIKNFLKYMLSKSRKSSQELVDILKNRAEVEGEDLGSLKQFLE